MLSAFGVLHKTEYEPGKYKPASQLSPDERFVARTRMPGRHQQRSMRAKYGHNANHQLSDVYQHWGVGPGISDAVKEESRKSKVHPKVEYGSSVTPELERHIDRTLNPHQIKELHHPVVFHHGKTVPQALAAAAGKHETTGHKGRVILNRDLIDEKGNIDPRIPESHNLKNVVAHELEHAAGRKRNPMVWSTPKGLKHKSSIGEEARADARSIAGPGLYRRGGRMAPVKGPVAARMLRGLGHIASEGGHPLGEALKQGGEASQQYNKIHRKVRSAFGQPKGMPHTPVADAAEFHGGKVVAGTAGVALGVHAYREHERKLKKSAFGVEVENATVVDHPDRCADSAFGVAAGSEVLSKLRKPMSDAQLRRRRKLAANLSTATATIGLAALGAKGGAAAARKFVKPAVKGSEIADKMERHTTTALTLGAGLGGAAGFNSAAISRAEARREPTVQHIHKGKTRDAYKAFREAATNSQKISEDVSDITGKARKLVPSRRTAALGYGGAVAAGSSALFGGSYLGSRSGTRSGARKAHISTAVPVKPKTPSSTIKKDWAKFDLERKQHDKQLLRQHGLRGAPTGVDRETRQQIWEARARQLNRKRNRWNRTRQGSSGVEQSSKIAAGTGTAIIAGSQIRDHYFAQHPEVKRDLTEGIADELRRGGADQRKYKLARMLVHSKPGYKTLAVTGGATALAVGGRQARIYAQKKTRKYSSASGGIAAGTARRMKDYDVNKSAFGVDHGEAM